MLDGLCTHCGGETIPFVRMFYGSPSTYIWEDAEGSGLSPPSKGTTTSFRPSKTVFARNFVIRCDNVSNFGRKIRTICAHLKSVFLTSGTNCGHLANVTIGIFVESE